MGYEWDNIEELYDLKDRNLKKGDVVTLTIHVDKVIDEISSQVLQLFISSWTYPNDFQTYKPFKLIKYLSINSEIIMVLKMITVKKKWMN